MTMTPEEHDGAESVAVEAPPTLLAAMLAARQEMGLVKRGGWNKHDEYPFAQLADILAVVDAPVASQGMAIKPEVTSFEFSEFIGRYEKKEVRCLVHVKTSVVLVATGEAYSVVTIGEGLDPRDKAYAKAVTGARKVGLQLLFNLATEDDPEATSDGRNDAPPREQRSRRRQQSDDAPPRQQSQSEPRQQKAQQTFASPPNWPDTKTDDLLLWLESLRTIPALKTAMGMFTNEESLTGSLADWDKVATAVAGRYKTLTANFTKYRDPELEASIKYQLEHINTAKQGQETFSPSEAKEGAEGEQAGTDTAN